MHDFIFSLRKILFIEVDIINILKKGSVEDALSSMKRHEDTSRYIDKISLRRFALWNGNIIRHYRKTGWKRGWAIARHKTCQRGNAVSIRAIAWRIKSKSFDDACALRLATFFRSFLIPMFVILLLSSTRSFKFSNINSQTSHMHSFGGEPPLYNRIAWFTAAYI